MADISKIQIESGTYDIKDVKARNNVTNLQNDIITRIKEFNTVSDLKNNENLVNNEYVVTKGYYNINDRGGAKYYITNEELIPDDASIIGLKNNLYAKLIYDNEINVKQFGCYGDNTHDDIDKLQLCLKFCSDNKLKTFIPSGTYLMSKNLLLYDYNVIYGENKATTELKTMAGVDLVYHTIVNESARDINARLARNDDSPSISQGYPKVSDVCTHYNHDIIIKHLTVNGNWQNRDLNNWNKYYETPNGNISREPGTTIELQRTYNIELDDLLVINGPQHNISTDAGADSYNEGVNYVSQYPTYNVYIHNIETNNQRFDDCITTHNSKYITIENCYVHVDNNVNGLYANAISNGIEIDDGSRHIKVINCLSKYNFNGFQAKGHSNTPSPYDVIFENCTAEACHMSMVISSNHASSNYFDIDNFCKDIIIKNFYSKNAYIFSNGGTSWNDKAYELLLDNCNNVVIDGWISIFGNPKDNIITNISSLNRTSVFENINVNIYITYKNIKVYGSQNDTNNYPLINLRGSSRNYIFDNIFCEGWSGYAMIDYSNASTNGYCYANNITLLKRNNDDKILNVNENNLGTRTNLYLLSATD